MATFITTFKFTDKSIQAIQETAKRTEAFKMAAKKIGVDVIGTYWTLGYFDGVLIFDAPDDETAAAAMLHLTAQGFIHTTTSRAFEASEIEKVVKMLAS